MKFAVRPRWASLVLVLAACGSSKTPPPPGTLCVMNSECMNPLSCTFGKCHVGCVEARDCASGETCVKGPSGAVCQLESESHCDYRSDCPAPLTCALDRKCRSECQADIDCPTKTQRCVLPDKVCAEPSEIGSDNKLKNAQATPVPETRDAGAASDARAGVDAPAQGGTGGAGNADAGAVDANLTGRDGGAGAGGTGGGGGSVATCTRPQVSFGDIVTGDANPSFTSGVGVRTGRQILVFSGYVGPAPGGTDAGATVNAVYAQPFDADTGKSQGATTVLFPVEDGPEFGVNDASVAPSGEIALLYSHSAVGGGSRLFAAFLAPSSPDAGAAGLQVVRTVPLESVSVGSPHVVWSAAAQAFVVSWKYLNTNWYIRVRKFRPDGRGAGGDANIVPSPTGSQNGSDTDEGRAGTSGSLVGVAGRNPSNGAPYLAVLDADGVQVGGLVTLGSAGVGPFIVTGGTTRGFVSIYHGGGTGFVVFVPTTSVAGDGGAAAGADADGGAPMFPTFQFPTTASTAQAISDDTGGAGGVGAVLLEQNGANFLYVQPDGNSRLAIGTILTSASGAQVAISNYRGSFAVSLYDRNAHSTQVVTSSCGQ